MDSTLIIEQQIEEPKERGRPKIDKPPKELVPRGRTIIIEQLKDPKTKLINLQKNLKKEEGN